MATLHCLHTIREVFDAVNGASHNLRPMLPSLADFIATQCAVIKNSLVSAPIADVGSGGHVPQSVEAAVAEVELQVALRSALAYLEKAHADAGPLLFFRRGTLGYELAEVVRGLQHAARKVHAAGLSTHNPTLSCDPSPIATRLADIEMHLRGEVTQMFAAHGGDLDAMLAASEHHLLMASLLRAALLAEDAQGLVQRRLSDDDATRHLFELHYDDVEMEMKQVTRRGRVFEVQVQIGSGAYGQVFMGRYLGVPVAVKEFPRETASIIETFEREVTMLCALRHPNILPIIGFTRADRAQDAKYALVTPLLAKDFNDAIVDPSYSLQARLRWCVDIACALVYLHGREPSPVRHGDLKPANVMLDADGNAVLLDFGLATASMTATLHTRGGGFTPAYAAPEVQAGGGRTTAADVFAFGLLLYEVWHGRRWFAGIDLQGHATNVDFLRAGLSPSLSPDVVPTFVTSLIAQCLSADPNQRPSAAEVLRGIRAGAMIPPTGAAARRAASLAEGDPTPFNPLPNGYMPQESAAAAFAELMAGDPPACVHALVTSIQLKTRALRDVGMARGQCEGEVFAIVAFTSDVRSVGLPIERNVWRRLNATLRQRDLRGFLPFAAYYWYLEQGLRKIAPEPPVVVWRGLSGVTLAELGPQYATGQRVCFTDFTSTSTLKHVMMDFTAAFEGASVMLQIEAYEGRSLQPYSLTPNEAEILLTPNTLCQVTVAVGEEAVTALASFPGGDQLPLRTAMVTLKQLPTPIPTTPTVASSSLVPEPAQLPDATAEHHSPEQMVDSVTSVDDRDLLANRVRMIFNVVTPQNYPVRMKELLELPIGLCEDVEITAMVDLMCDLAVRPDVEYAHLYSNLMANLVQKHSRMHRVGKTMRRALLDGCQRRYEQPLQLTDQEKMDEKGDAVPEVELQAKMMQLNAKRRASNTFLGHLFVSGLVNERVVNFVLFTLLYGRNAEEEKKRKPTEIELEMFCDLLKIVVRHLTPTTRAGYLAGYMNSLGRILPMVSDRIRCILENILELARSGWTEETTSDDDHGCSGASFDDFHGDAGPAYNSNGL
jgi:serine/threonine protein kinase